MREYWRGDINGLRFFAIVPVVLFHAGVTAIPGGFTGVDIFFVISGFLITGNLLREVAGTGTVNIGGFWAARLRRLVPALALTVVVTMSAAVLISSPLTWDEIGTQAIASVFYVSNMLFAFQATDYFAADIDQSPFLHMWSLGVEEQFYIVWPILIIGGALLANRLRVNRRTILVSVFALTLVGSFALSLYATTAFPGLAFYSLPTRAWEFAVGGFLALIPLASVIRGRLTGEVLSAVGVVVIVFGLFTIHEEDPFPGTAAIIPVVGTALVLAGGTARPAGVTSRFLGSAPLQWIGSRSYSWYLWHWPFIVLACLALDSQALWIKLAAAAASLVAAQLSFRYVENIIRSRPEFAASVRRSYLFTLGPSFGVAALAVLLMFGGNYLLQTPGYVAYAKAQGVDDLASCAGTEQTPSGIGYCLRGNAESSRSVVVVGDSHAAHWIRAIDAAAKEEGIRVLGRWKSSCPAALVSVVNTNNVRDPSCAQYQKDTLELIRELRPDGVLIAQATAYSGRILGPDGERVDADEQLEEWRNGYTELLATVEEAGSGVAIIEDNPRLRTDPLLCATRLGKSVANCTPTRTEGTEQIVALESVGREVLADRGISAIWSTVDELCSEESCVIEEDGVPVYRDNNHLSAAWTMMQVTELRRMLVSAAFR